MVISVWLLLQGCLNKNMSYFGDIFLNLIGKKPSQLGSTCVYLSAIGLKEVGVFFIIIIPENK